MKTILHFISTQHQRPTECYTQDPSGYEKCVSMCQKSIENLVSLLEEEEAAEARRRPKVVNTISILSTSTSISILVVYYIYTIYIYISTPGGEAARPDHLHHHQPQPGNFILLHSGKSM